MGRLEERVAPGTLWRHRKGGTYRVVGVAAARSSVSAPAIEGMSMVIYTSGSGGHRDSALWARPLDEFLDGRFTRVGDGR